MKKLKSFKILWKYLKKDKLRLFLYLLLVIISYLPSLFTPYFLGKAVEFLINSDWNSFIINLAIWNGFFLVASSILQAPRELLYNRLDVNFLKNVSNDMYKKIDNLPTIAFEEIGVGEFINRLYTDPDRVISLLSSLVRLICKSFIVIAVFAICFKVSLLLGLELTIFAIIMGTISAIFFPKIKKTQENIKKETDAYVKTATENITGIREIKSLGVKEIIEKSISKRIDELVKNAKKQQNYSTFYFAANNFIYYSLQFLILISTGYMFMQGKITFAIYTMIQSYIGRIDGLVESLSDFGVNFNKVSVSLNRIDEILNNRLYADEKYGNIELNNPKGIIEFKNVKFRYRENEENTLKGLNLTINPNEKVAIIGKSGNGKSTIFNLLSRYFDATEGEILIDGINIKDLNEKSLRNNISIIRQTPFLFNLSLFDNFKIVKEDVTLEEIREVCKRAYIDDYIMALPNKYDTIIGEGGVNLSGGQKQRIAIARTLLLNTKIILFDEATSALDNESQSYIKKTIDDLVKDHTIIIVAHRLSTIIDSDIINVIDNGQLVASGTHSELMKNSEIYQNLYSADSTLE